MGSAMLAIKFSCSLVHSSAVDDEDEDVDEEDLLSALVFPEAPSTVLILVISSIFARRRRTASSDLRMARLVATTSFPNRSLSFAKAFSHEEKDDE